MANEPTTPVVKIGDPDDGKILGASVRAWIVLLLTECVCLMSIWEIAIVEPLYSAYLLSLGFYFGQKYPSNGNGNGKVSTQ